MDQQPLCIHTFPSGVLHGLDVLRQCGNRIELRNQFFGHLFGSCLGHATLDSPYEKGNPHLQAAQNIEHSRLYFY